MGVAQNLGHGGEQHLLGLIQQETRFLNIGRGAVAHQLLLVGSLLRMITGMHAVRAFAFRFCNTCGRPSWAARLNGYAKSETGAVG